MPVTSTKLSLGGMLRVHVELDLASAAAPKQLDSMTDSNSCFQDSQHWHLSQAYRPWKLLHIRGTAMRVQVALGPSEQSGRLLNLKHLTSSDNLCHVPSAPLTCII